MSPGQQQPAASRRSLFGLAAAGAAAAAIQAVPGGAAHAEGLLPLLPAAPAAPAAAAPPGTPVVPALSLPQYLAQIQIAAPQAWAEIEANIDAGKYRDQSLQLVLPPFDTVRQAAFFVPWVLLRAQNEPAAIATQEAYLRFKDTIVAFDDRLIAAAARVPYAPAALVGGGEDGEGAEDGDVWAAYEAMRAALDEFLGTVGSSAGAALY